LKASIASLLGLKEVDDKLSLLELQSLKCQTLFGRTISLNSGGADSSNWRVREQPESGGADSSNWRAVREPEVEASRWLGHGKRVFV
jgi:hypothetical protein